MVAFNKTSGEAQKSNLNQYQYKTGANALRLFGDVLPRYVYWVKGENNKNIPMECLSFDRDKEAFTNVEKDYVREAYPDLNCGWAYVMQGLDLETGEVKVINLKKKLFQQIINLASEPELGDPTDPETGWDIHFTKEKTGPQVYNVEYNLQPLKCQKGKRPLTSEELDLVAAASPISEMLARPTPESQKTFLDRIMAGSTEANEDSETLKDHFDVS